MIEVPGAALTADLLARQVSFFSIGTNDLAQYCLAADRGDPDVSHVQTAFHPALLRLIRLVARIGRRHGVRVSVCGEMAADPTALALLIGLGVTEFSMRASAIPAARRTVARIRVDEARAAARRAMRGAAAGEVRALFAGAMGLRVPAETDPRREA
jgi:phosphoenolpyruvate-protein kinase (PTS system EI component)